jgi:hypothetical protein
LGVERQGKAHRATTVWVDDNSGLALTRLSFANNGAAQAINAGTGATNDPVSVRVEMCSFEAQLSLQDDGSFVEGGGTPSTYFRRNWCTNTGKGALRWDGMYPGTLGGEMLENVAWNTSALKIKGDQHNVTRNTVFDAADIEATRAMHDRPRYQDHTSALDNHGSVHFVSASIGAGTKTYNPLAGQKSVYTLNIFDAVAVQGAQCPTAPHCTIPGQWSENLIATKTPGGAGVAFDIRAELRDPYHRDFRPCPNSQAAKLGAGAYVSAPATHIQNASYSYWIPGRRELAVASTALPPDGAIGVHVDTDLMFLPARRALGHVVYFGKAGGGGAPLARLASLPGPDANIAQLKSPLSPFTAFAWRVDTVTAEGVQTGTEWRFSTGENASCSVAPHPPPAPSPSPPAPSPSPPHMSCSAAEAKYCPGLAHTGAGKGSECFECVVNNNGPFETAGCFKKGTRHEFIETFCGLAPPAPAPAQ